MKLLLLYMLDLVIRNEASTIGSCLFNIYIWYVGIYYYKYDSVMSDCNFKYWIWCVILCLKTHMKCKTSLKMFTSAKFSDVCEQFLWWHIFSYLFSCTESLSILLLSLHLSPSEVLHLFIVCLCTFKLMSVFLLHAFSYKCN